MAQKGISFKITAVNKTKQAFRGITSGLKKVSGAVFNLKTALTGAVGVAGMGLLIKNSLTATDRLGKMSNVLGIAVKDLQTLRLASEIGGIEFETFAKATRRLTDNFGDFLNGTGEATLTFKALGISQSDAIALSGDQMAILGLVADRLDQVQNSTLKLKFAQEIFGGRGAELINVLKGGSEALKQFAIESNKFGSLNKKQVEAVENFNDSIVRMKTVFMNIVNQIVANISPAFLKLSEHIREKVLKSIEDANGSVQNFAKVGAKDLIDFGIKAIKMFESLVVGVGSFVVSLKRAIEVIQHPFSKKNRQQFEDFSFSLQKIINILEGFKKNVDEVTSSTDNLHEAFNKTKDNIDETGKKLQFVEDRLTRLESSSDSFGNAIAKSFEKATLSGEKLSEVMRSLGASLIQMIYNETVTKPLAEKISSVIRDVLGVAIDKTKEIEEKNRKVTNAVRETNGQRLIANSLETTNNNLLISKLATEQLITAEKRKQTEEQENKNKAQGTAMLMSGNPLGFIPFMAKGGSVAGGKPYVVGEQGAEIFQPSSNGTIIPNHKIGSGGDSIRIVQEINIMPSVSDVARAEIFGMLPLIKQEALNGVMDARNRGGSFARALGVKA